MRGGFLAIMAAMLLCVAYVCARLWRITPGGWPLRATLVGLFLVWMASFFGVFLGWVEHLPVRAAAVFYDVSHPWLVAFVYLLILFVLADFAVLVRVLPRRFLEGSAAGLVTVLGLVAAVMVAGAVHYRHKYRVEMTIRTEKPLERPLTVVLASDLHLGYHNRRAELARWIDLVAGERPDLVLIGGDLIDRSLRPILEGDYAAEFRRLGVPVWAVPGNHEYYSHLDRARGFFDQAGIRLLRDSSATLGGIRVIGRDDRTNPKRKPLSALTVPDGAFTLLLDHQPFHLEEARDAGIDFQFSGHTHYGQFWPVSWITATIFQKAWGPLTLGRTRYYVSSGLGIWGPKIRIGTRSEYLVLHIEP